MRFLNQNIAMKSFNNFRPSYYDETANNTWYDVGVGVKYRVIEKRSKRSTMATIYLIRHGESAANAGLKTKDTALIPLTQLGEQQAKEVPAKLPGQLDYIIYSSYLRTKQTAKPTIALHPGVPVEEWAAVREFTYLDPKECNDTTPEERKPMVDAFWTAMNPNLQTSPEVESFAHFIERVRESHELLHDEFGGTHQNVALFTHALFMKAFFQVLEKPRASVQELMETFFDCPVIYNCDIYKHTV